MATRKLKFQAGLNVARATPRLPALVLALGLAQACSSSHGAQGADTNTSWLKACVDDGDCTDSTRCLDHVCTLACTLTEARASSCKPLGARAICDTATATCDLACSEDAECSALRAGLSCDSGRCREPGALSASAQTLQLTVPREVNEESAVPDKVDSAWLGDHWRIAVSRMGGTQEPDGPPDFASITVTDLFPDGHVEQDYVESESLGPGSGGRVLVGKDGRVLHVMKGWALGEEDTGPPRCETRFYGPDSMSQVRVLEGCGTAELQASLNAQGDWLVFEQWTEAQQLFVSARLYQPEQGVLGPRVELLRRDFLVGVLHADVDAQERVGLAWSEPTGLARRALVPAQELLSGPLAATAWRDVSYDSRPSGANDHGGMVGAPVVSAGWMVYVVPGSADDWHPLAIQFDADAGVQARQVPLALKLSEAQVSRELESTLYPIPDRNLLAYCRVERALGEAPSSVWLHVFDYDGALQAAPVRVASGPEYLKDCKLSWSGEAFLVTWSEGLTGAPPRARIVSLAPEIDASDRP